MQLHTHMNILHIRAYLATHLCNLFALATKLMKIEKKTKKDKSKLS